MNNIWNTWGYVFNSSLQELWWGFIQFVPRLLIAILLFVVGWVLASIIAKAFEQVFGALKVDVLLEKTGLHHLMERMGHSLDSGHFVGQIMRWFIIILFAFPSLSLIGLDSIADFLKEDVLMFLPRVIIAAFILIIAAIVADAISKATLAGAKSLSLSSANMLAGIAKYSIWIFAFIVAFEQLGINSAYMQILFAGIIGMIAVAGAIAFGIGGKEHASRFLSKLNDEIKK
jgi:hypothetical protein